MSERGERAKFQNWFHRNFWRVIGGAFVFAGAMLAVAIALQPNCQSVTAALPTWQDSAGVERRASQEAHITCYGDCEVSSPPMPVAEPEPEAAQSQANERCDTPEELDLVAQRIVAHWTAFIGGFTALGLFVLIATLIEARLSGEKVADVTRKVNADQNRAWLSVNCRLGPQEARQTHDGLSGIYFPVDCVSQNHGNSPATHVSFHAEMDLLGVDCPDLSARMHEYCDSIRARADNEGEAIFPGATGRLGHMVLLTQLKIDAELGRHEFKMIVPVVYGCINYKTPLVTGVRQTRFAFHLTTIGENGHPKAIMPGGVPFAEMPMFLTHPGIIAAD